MHKRAKQELLATAWDFLILLSSLAMSMNLRLTVPIGTTLGESYKANNQEILLIIASGTVIFAHIVIYMSAQHIDLARYLNIHRYRFLLVVALLYIILILLLLPEVSQLQLVYYFFALAILGFIAIAIPGRLNISPFDYDVPLEWISTLYASRHLLFIWLGYRIRARYSQTFLGLIWIVLVPLSEAIIFAFVFGTLFEIRTVGAPYISFFLSGLVVFHIFQSIVTKGIYALSRQISLIKKVYFPREIALLLLVGEALVDFCFTLVAMILINGLLGIYPNIYYIFLPVPILIMVCLATGVGLILSWLSLVIRDLQQFIGILVRLLFYVTVLFAGSRVPPRFKFLQMVNPLSAIVETFRDIVLYETAPQWDLLFYPAVLSLAVLYSGYVFFKTNEERVVDFL